MFKYRSFTYNDEQYINAAEKETQLLIRNPQSYKFAGNWTIKADLSKEEQQAIYKKFSRSMRRKSIICWWVREFNEKNHLHYHFLIVKQTLKINAQPSMGKEDTTNKIKRLIIACIPVEIRRISTIYVEEIQNIINYVRYILKSKCKNEFTTDKHKNKRTLFIKIGLKKIGSIGKFWIRSKKILWNEIIEECKAKSELKEQEQEKKYKEKIQRYEAEWLEKQEILKLNIKDAPPLVLSNIKIDLDGVAEQDLLENYLKKEMERLNNEY